MPIAQEVRQEKNAPDALEAFARNFKSVRGAFSQLAQFIDSEARERQSFERGE